MVSTLSKAVLAGVACGALGVGLGGFWAFRDDPVRQEPMRTFIRPTAGQAPAALAAAAPHGVAVVPEPSLTELGAPETGSEPAPDAPAALPSEGLQIKRLVVTDRIEDREPVAAPQLRADGTQVFAFVELANPGADAQSIEIVFEHESGQQVGFVKLPVPKEKSRWRTWGKTEQIKKTGRWVAKVRSSGGDELMRQDFVVGQG